MKEQATVGFMQVMGGTQTTTVPTGAISGSTGGIGSNDFVDAMKRAKESEAKSSDTCPSCGYCPHCKRGGHNTLPYYPYYPYYPYQGFYWYGNGIANSGGTYIDSNGNSVTYTSSNLNSR